LVMVLLLFGLVTGATPAWGWGDLGHKIVCQIAFQELNNKARTEVVRLIALDETFDSFTDACTWPDHPRKRAEEHFINVTRSVQTITLSQCPGAPKCLFTAIPADLEVLRTSNDDAAKLASLKYLGHWVGDIHQPLQSHSRTIGEATSFGRAAPVPTASIPSGTPASLRRSSGPTPRQSPGICSMDCLTATGPHGWRSRSRGGQMNPSR